MYSGQAVIMFPGAGANRLGKPCNPEPNGLNAVAALDVDSSAIFMDLFLCDGSVEAQLLAANGTQYRLNRRTAH
jgi:hypothetical protein